jgi:hypothetical protein
VFVGMLFPLHGTSWDSVIVTRCRLMGQNIQFLLGRDILSVPCSSTTARTARSASRSCNTGQASYCLNAASERRRAVYMYGCDQRNHRSCLVRRGGLEPPTRCLEGSRSIRTELPALDPRFYGSAPAGGQPSGQNATVDVFEQIVVPRWHTL